MDSEFRRLELNDHGATLAASTADTTSSNDHGVVLKLQSEETVEIGGEAEETRHPETQFRSLRPLTGFFAQLIDNGATLATSEANATPSIASAVNPLL